jgi:hypothetical protein
MVERLCAVLLVLVLAACGSTPEAADARLGEAVQRLPGVYERQGGEEARVLAIVPIFVASLTGYRFYVQEMDAQDSRRVISQRVLSFDAAKGGKVIQTNWSLADPTRWRTGPTNPELFKSMVQADLRPAGRSQIDTTSFTGPELVFDANGSLVADAAGAPVVHYRKR